MNCELAWSSLVEGDEGSFLPNCQANLVIALHALSILFWHFINTTAYHLGRNEPSSPFSCCAPGYGDCVLHDLGQQCEADKIAPCTDWKLPVVWRYFLSLISSLINYKIGLWSLFALTMQNILDKKILSAPMSLSISQCIKCSIIVYSHLTVNYEC